MKNASLKESSGDLAVNAETNLKVAVSEAPVNPTKETGARQKDAFKLMMAHKKGALPQFDNTRLDTTEAENVLKNADTIDKSKTNLTLGNMSESYWEDDTGIRQPLTVKDSLMFKSKWAEKLRRSSLSTPSTSTPRALSADRGISCAAEARRLSSSLFLTPKRVRSPSETNTPVKAPRTDTMADSSVFTPQYCAPVPSVATERARLEPPDPPDADHGGGDYGGLIAPVPPVETEHARLIPPADGDGVGLSDDDPPDPLGEGVSAGQVSEDDLSLDPALIPEQAVTQHKLEGILQTS